jgi:hypothetical protein
MMARFALVTLAAVLGLAPGATAQDTVVVTRRGEAQIGTAAERRAVAIFNDADTRRIEAADTIEPSEIVDGSVAVFDASLRVEGTIRGDLVAINADVVLASGALVEGDVLVVGGGVREDPGSRILGSLEQHGSRPRVRRVAGALELEERPPTRDAADRRLRRSYPTTRATVLFSTGGTYNRVEGLPVLIGPRVSWATWGADARLDGLAIFRTGAGSHFGNRSIGYRVRGRVRLGADRTVQLRARGYDEVMPIEDWQLRTDEVGWASFLLRRDYRDYYLERGLAGSARWEATSWFTLGGGVGWTDATSIRATSPWTPFRGGEPWRANPVIDDGTFTTITAGLELDTRNGRRRGGGLRLTAEWEHGIGEDVIPRDLPQSVRDPIPTSGYSYDRLWGDLRLYAPLIGGGLALRAVGGGEVGSGPLPVQRRLSLGGPDPMPGFAFRQFACNEGVDDPAMPALCDRLFLFQAEFRTGFGLGSPPEMDDDDYEEAWHLWHAFDWTQPHFVLFTDGGTAWLRKDGPGTFRWDLGAGFSLGGLGVYIAQGLESGGATRGIIRLHRRF